MSTDILANIAERPAYELARTADCHEPNTSGSAGAAFLERTRDALIESVRYLLDSDSAGNLAEAAAMVRDGDDRHQLADDAPSVYTSARWEEFTDLGAWGEDVTELGTDLSDLTSCAGVALYMIADRLVGALLDEIETAAEDDDED